MINLPLKTENGKVIEISALCFPVICSPLPTNITVKDYPHLKDLKLADCSNGYHSIDVLIDSDYYWDIVEGVIIRGVSGPTACSEK